MDKSARSPGVEGKKREMGIRKKVFKNWGEEKKKKTARRKQNSDIRSRKLECLKT